MWGVPVALHGNNKIVFSSVFSSPSAVRVRVNRLVWWSRLWHAVSAVSVRGGARSQHFSCCQDQITELQRCDVKCGHDQLPPVQRAVVRGSWDWELPVVSRLPHRRAVKYDLSRPRPGRVISQAERPSLAAEDGLFLSQLLISFILPPSHYLLVVTTNQFYLRNS